MPVPAAVKTRIQARALLGSLPLGTRPPISAFEMMMMTPDRPIGSFLTRLGTWTASPVAFGIVVAYAVLWLIFDRQSLDWHAVAALAIWLMTLFIQRAEHRDTQALHAKLDELLLVHGHARNELVRIDDEEPEEVEEYRAEMRKDENI
jgi:low affinity Fe/Cu permease